MGSDNSLSPKLNHSEVSKNQQASKKRKDVEKTVVTVKIGTNNAILGKLKHEGPPSDSWSWRKYGQKPIKGSPHPRGYYRCSTSKGCSAKKQVERCKTDDSLLIITYTSSHNHPGPHDDQDQDHHDHDHDHDHDLDHIKSHEPQETSDHRQQISSTLDNHHDQDQQDGHNIKKDTNPSDFQYIHDESSVEDIIVNVGLELLDQQDTLKTTSTTNSNNALGKEVICNFSSSQEENDFFDELEELPTYSKFKSFMRTHLYDEIRNYIPIVPS